MLDKLLCWLGFHAWNWKLLDDLDWKAGKEIQQDTPPPPEAVCERCGCKYCDFKKH